MQWGEPWLGMYHLAGLERLRVGFRFAVTHERASGHYNFVRCACLCTAPGLAYSTARWCGQTEFAIIIFQCLHGADQCS